MQYNSQPVILQVSAEAAYNKFSNLEGLKQSLTDLPEDKIPADKLEMLKNIEINGDSITIPGGPMGSITLDLVSRQPFSALSFQAAGLPIAFSITLHLRPIDDAHCNAHASIDVELPAMMKPLVGPMMQQITDQLSNLFLQIPLS